MAIMSVKFARLVMLLDFALPGRPPARTPAPRGGINGVA